MVTMLILVYLFISVATSLVTEMEITVKEDNDKKDTFFKEI